MTEQEGESEDEPISRTSYVRRLALIIVAALLIAGGGAVAWHLRAEADRPYDEWEDFGRRLGPRVLSVPPDVSLLEVAATAPGAPVDARPFDIAPFRTQSPIDDLLLAFRAAPRAPVGNAQPWWRGPVVVVSRDRLRLELADLTLPLPADGGARGFDGRYKRSGPNDLYVVPLANALGWVRGMFLSLDKAKFKDTLELERSDDGPRDGSTVTLMLDRDVPARVLIEVLFTAGQTEFSYFRLCARRGDQLVTIDTAPPKAIESRGRRAARVAAAIVKEGFTLSVDGRNVGPGCHGYADGVAVPNLGAKHDYAALRTCAMHLKDDLPELAEERAVAIAVKDFSQPWSAVDRAATALARTDDGQPLFPDFEYK